MSAEQQSSYLAVRSQAFAGVRALLTRALVIGAMSAIGTTWLIRQLGPTAWGGFLVSLGLLVTCDVVLTRCLFIGLMQRSEPTDEASLRSVAALVGIAGTALALILVALAFVVPTWYHAPHVRLLLQARAGCTLLYAGRTLSVTLLERDLRYGAVATTEVADMLTFYVVAITAVALGGGVALLAAATVARGVVACLVAHRARRSPVLGTRPRPAAARLLPIGLPLAAVTAVAAFEALIPSFVIDSEREVGFFVTSLTILGYAMTIHVVVGRVGIPSLSAVGAKAAATAASGAATLSTFLSLAVLVPVSATANLWLAPLLGAEWSAGTGILRWVAVGLAVTGLTGVINAAFKAAGQTMVLLRVRLAAAAVYLVLAGGFAAVWGADGAAAGFAVGRCCVAAAYVVLGQHRLGISSRRAVLVLASAAVVFALSVLATSRSDALGLAVLGVLLAAWLVGWRDLVRQAVQALGLPQAWRRVRSRRASRLAPAPPQQ